MFTSFFELIALVAAEYHDNLGGCQSSPWATDILLHPTTLTPGLVEWLGNAGAARLLLAVADAMSAKMAALKPSASAAAATSSTEARCGS